MTSFFVHGIPAPQGSKRHVGGGRMIESSKKLIPWRNAVAKVAFQHFTQPLDGPLRVDLEFVMPRPKAWGHKRQDPMTQRPDSDKLARAVFDAITGIAITDDSHITRHSVHKRRAAPNEPTGAYITITKEED